MLGTAVCVAKTAEGDVAHKTYISFKTEDEAYKVDVQSLADLDVVDKSLDVAIDSSDEDYILQTIRSEYLADSTVTIHLIGLYGAENAGAYEQRFIKRELQASLYNSADNTKNGVLGIVLPAADDAVFKGSAVCLTCGNSHNIVAICNETTVREFSYNYYIPNGKCAHPEEDRYCVLARWDDFLAAPTSWIDAAFDKRAEPIASKTRVYPD
jgi:hypothetical protein